MQQKAILFYIVRDCYNINVIESWVGVGIERTLLVILNVSLNEIPKPASATNRSSASPPALAKRLFHNDGVRVSLAGPHLRVTCLQDGPAVAQSLAAECSHQAD